MFMRNEVIHGQLGITTIEEKILQLTNNFYERMNGDPNRLITDAISYAVKEIR